jgi:RecA/RadA recombinase/intein/homing endonuclease
VSKRLAALQETINKKYKGNYVVRASDPSAFDIQRIPTGIFALDAITYGGIPFGRISILWGEFSSGKTSAALSIVGRAQRTCRECFTYMRISGTINTMIDEASGEVLLEGGKCDEASSNFKKIDRLRNIASKGNLTKTQEDELQKFTIWLDSSTLKDKHIHVQTTRSYECPKCNKTEPLTAVWIDVEGVFDRSWASNFGIDINELWVVRPTYAEQAIDIMNHLVRTGECDLIVLDSVAAMVPAKEIEDSVTGDAVVSLKTSDGSILTTPISDACSKWEKGELDGGVSIRSYDQETASFGWKHVANIWRRPARKQIFKIKTKYGRDIRVTEDHSVFRVLPVNKRCVNRKKNTFRYSAHIECVKGKHLQVGDHLLLEDSFEGAKESKSSILLTDYLEHAERPVFASGLSSEVIEQCRVGRDPKRNWRKGRHGNGYVSLEAAHDNDVSFCGNEMLYGRGSSAVVSNRIESDVIGWLIGFVVGDGYVWDDHKSNGIRLYIGENEFRQMMKRVARVGQLGPTIRAYRRKTSRMFDVTIQSPALAHVFRTWFGGQKALTKRLPPIVFDLDENGRRAVLEGLIDSDGHRLIERNRYRISISTSSKLLVWDIVELLKTLRITSSIRWRGPSRSVVVEENGERVIHGSESWNVNFSGWSLYGEPPSVSRKGSGRSMIETASGVPVKITSIEECDREEVFDVAVPGTETFVANGLLVHNSAEKAQQALMARLMNKAIRTWVAGMAEAEVSETDTSMPTILLINQIREKVGVFYGDPSIMPGGKGQAFGNSLTIKLYGSKYAFDDDSGVTFSRIIKASVSKSKVSPPRESAEYVLWLRNNGGNKTGSTEEPKVILQSTLKEGVLVKDKSNTYKLLGKKYKTQKEIMALMMEDEMFLEDVRSAALEAMFTRKLRSDT